MLVVDSLSKRYGDRLAVDRVSFNVEAGEVVGFLGPNGAGKTTTMRIVTGFIPPTGGTVRVAGFDVKDDSLSVRRHVGYLPESAPLYYEQRVEDYLTYRARLKDVPARERRARVEEAMARTLITDRRRQIIRTLSKGYKQRVGLSDALLGNVRLLVLDEPTIGLDPNQKREVHSLIRELDDQRKLAILISSHILSDVEALCERVVIIREGRIVAKDTTQNLKRQFEEGGILRVVVRGGDDDAVREAIASVPGVLKVYAEQDRLGAAPARGEPVPGDDVRVRVETELEHEADVRDAVQAAVRDKGWKLRELATAGLSLEEVFYQVTHRRGATDAGTPAAKPSATASS